MTEPAGETSATPTLNLSALLAEALAKSSVCWVESGGQTRAAWFAIQEGTVLLVTGPGEQRLPPLGDDARLLLRSKDSGGRLLEVAAAVRVLDPDDSAWEPAVSALAAERLNATDDLPTRWRESGTVYALRPYGAPLQSPGTYADHSGSAPFSPADSTTGGWRPFHLGGRPERRRHL
ncbi:MAG: hypothetical protein U0Q21_04160 [Dermatophilaceae bacterium]